MLPDAGRTPLPNPDETAARRAELFRETPLETVERWALGTAWALKPQRVGGLPPLGAMWLKSLVTSGRGLPDPEQTLASPEGLCGIVRDLSVPTLVEAYRQGLFTFAHFGPLKWFSPAQRCVLFLDELHIGKTIRRLLRQGRYRVTFDRDFESVIKACAGRRDGKWHVTWITPRIMRVYAALHDAGYVHSFEVWNAQGQLVGGGYGVALGNVFYTESQFSLEPDTSKLGFAVLNTHLAHWGFALNDGKSPTPTIIPMGFREIPGAEFRAHLLQGTAAPGKPGRWEVEIEPAQIGAAKGGPSALPKGATAKGEPVGSARILAPSAALASMGDFVGGPMASVAQNALGALV